MFRTFYNQNDRQFVPGSTQQMFIRINNSKSQQRRMTKTSQQQRNFPFLDQTSSKRIIHVGKSLDNSKQNLMFQSFLQKVKSASKIDQKSLVSNYLNQLRKDYDKMHKQTKQQISSINLKKKDIQFIKQRVKLHQSSVQSLQQNTHHKMNQIKNIAQKQLQVQSQRKTLDHIINRMKKQQVFYKQFGRLSQGYIGQKKRVLKALKENVMCQEQKLHRIVGSLEGVNRQFQRNQQFRARKLEDYCQKIQNIRQKQVFIQERKQRTLQLQSIQSNDTLKAKNIQMANIRLINKVADCLFENKIQHLIQKYQGIQKAFHTIQVKTSISDPTLLASKFFSYEQLTQNLLKSIFYLEKQLQQQTKRNQELKQQFRRSEQRTYNNDVSKAQVTREVKPTGQQIHQLNQKQLQYYRIAQWIERQFKRLNISKGQGIGQDELVRKFFQVCMKTKEQTSEVTVTFKQHEKYTTPGIRIKKIVKEANLNSKNQQPEQAQLIQAQKQTEDEFLKVARAGSKRNFNIKQKIINIGTSKSIKQSKSQTICCDQKQRVSDNR